MIHLPETERARVEAVQRALRVAVDTGLLSVTDQFEVVMFRRELASLLLAEDVRA